MLNVLVTGATGQLGSGLVEALLSRGDEVRALVLPSESTELLRSKGVKICVGDLCDADSVRAAADGMDVVFHAAGLVAYSPQQRERLEAINVEGTRNIVEASVDAGVRRLVYSSTIGALGYVDGDGEGDEQTAFNWNRRLLPYFDSKQRAEALLLGQQQVEAVALNPGIMMGAEDRNRNGTMLLERVASHQVTSLLSGATTLATRGDIVDGHIRAMENGRPGERYILGGTAISWDELFGRVAAVVGGTVPTRRLPQWLLLLAAYGDSFRVALSGDSPRWTHQFAEISRRNRKFSSSKAISELGYSPSPLEEGLEACWNWTQAQGE